MCPSWLPFGYRVLSLVRWELAFDLTLSLVVCVTNPFSREAEKTEIERRRELTEEERVKEDMEYLAKKAQEESANKDSQPVEKYHHKGAFFMVSVLPPFHSK